MIGAGVVGCAVAQALARAGITPLVLEAGPRIAEGVTSRNSGVIHAGIYYPPDSLKARSCLRGKELLVEWCEKHQVPWQRTGKWIVGQAGDEADLQATLDNALRSGATGLSWKNAREIQDSLPQVKAQVALFSAETGIVDPYLFSRSLLDDALGQGADLITDAPVQSIEDLAGGAYLLRTPRGEIAAERVINSAGLYADSVARLAGVNDYQIYPWRGDYFRSRRNLGLKTLVYPVKKKDAPGLGIHVTLDLAGEMKLGPDVEFSKSKEDFSPRADKKEKFFQAASTYLPGLQMDDLVFDTVGVRPKLRSPQDKKELDFILRQDRPGFVNLVGIESPGLTAAMALGELVLDMIKD